MRWWPVLVGMVLSGGCVLRSADGGPRAPAEGAAPEPVATSPWLSPAARIANVVRLVTPHGLELRQAVFVRPAGQPQAVLLLRLRDYTVRTADRPDRQTLVRAWPAEGRTEPVELPPDHVPLRVHVSRSRRVWALSALELAQDADVAAAPFGVLATGIGGSPALVPTEQRLFPLGLLDDDTLVARAVKSVTLAGGLVAVVPDWAAGAWQRRLAEGEWVPAEPGFFTPSPGGLWAAGYTVRADPALPAEACIEYFAGSVLPLQQGSVRRFSFPYLLGDTALPWEPPLCWVDNQTLATIQFLPEALGEGATAGGRGLFRLVTLSAASGEVRLAADRLPLGLPALSCGGVLFYTRQEHDGQAARWELWAAGADGLAKQRLWTVNDDTLYLSVEDALDGRRLLVQRQYFSLRDGEPELHSELREFSLDPPAGGLAELELEPLKPLTRAAAEAGELAKPWETAPGPPPLPEL